MTDGRVIRYASIFLVIMFTFSNTLPIFAETKYYVDSNVFDFGTVLDNQGPISCKFKIKNIGSEPFSILNISSTCGCTKTTWSKAVIKPGNVGDVNVIFSNDEGPYPFDKSISVLISGNSRPLVLHIKGNVVKGHDNFDEKYKYCIGPLRVKDKVINFGDVKLNDQKQGVISILNAGRTPILLQAIASEPNIDVDLFPKSLLPGNTSKVEYRITLKGVKYGRHIDYIELCWKKLHKKKWHSGLLVLQYTVNSFPYKAETQPRMLISENHFSLGRVNRRMALSRTIDIENIGYAPLNIFQIEVQNRPVLNGPIKLCPGELRTISIDFNFSCSRRGKNVECIDIYSDSSVIPVGHIYVTYIVDWPFRLFQNKRRRAN